MPFFTHDSLTLFYTSSSSGPTTSTPILLLHGWACDSHDWSFQIPYLLTLGLRVIALDQRGHGRSSAPSASESDNYAAYDFNNFAADAIALLDHLEVEEAVLLGHSMGTVIASIIAVRYPERIKGLVLFHPIYGTPGAGRAQLAERLRAASIESQSKNQVADLAVQFWEQSMYTPTTPPWLRTWTLRRLVGNDVGQLVGSMVNLVALEGTVMGQSSETKEFMRRRKGPRLAFTTLPPAEPWEREIGVDEEGGDEVHGLKEGTFSHMVQWEEVNRVLGEWLGKRGFV